MGSFHHLADIKENIKLVVCSRHCSHLPSLSPNLWCNPLGLKTPLPRGRERHRERERERDEWAGIGAGDWMQAVLSERIRAISGDRLPSNQSQLLKREKKKKKKAQAQFGCSKRERERESS